MISINALLVKVQGVLCNYLFMIILPENPTRFDRLDDIKEQY